MALYGSVAGIKRLLQTNPDGGGSFSTDEEDRITELQAAVSALIESKTGMVFGTNPATSETIEVEGERSSTLFLPKGIRTVTSITEGPDWSGSAWVNGSLMASDTYRLNAKVNNGAYRQLIRLNGWWGGRYVIVGVWEDQVPSVPDEITYVANFVSAEIFKGQSASPHGLMGPEGAMVPIRDPWKATEVKDALCRWQIGPMMWVA
jgi:hypothetical protein